MSTEPGWAFGQQVLATQLEIVGEAIVMLGRRLRQRCLRPRGVKTVGEDWRRGGMTISTPACVGRGEGRREHGRAAPKSPCRCAAGKVAAASSCLLPNPVPMNVTSFAVKLPHIEYPPLVGDCLASSPLRFHGCQHGTAYRTKTPSVCETQIYAVDSEGYPL